MDISRLLQPCSGISEPPTFPSTLVSPSAASITSHLSTTKKQSKWSQKENELVINLRGRGMKWEDISKNLPGRSAISCRLHYQNYLERKCEWNEEEKNKLATLYERYVFLFVLRYWKLLEFLVWSIHTKPQVIQLPFWHQPGWNRKYGLVWPVTLVYPGGQQKPCTGSSASKKWPIEPVSPPLPWPGPVAYLHQAPAIAIQILAPEAVAGVDLAFTRAP